MRNIFIIFAPQNNQEKTIKMPIKCKVGVNGKHIRSRAENIDTFFFN